MNDAAYDNYIMHRHDEAVMARATREQCIFLFVEGKSEEIAVPILFTDIINLDTVGVKIANYGGRGNLEAALHLLNLTLSHGRPIILTYDNDPESIKSLNSCKQQGLITDLIYLFPIPNNPIVTYASSHRGGAFEESFSTEIFMNAAFTTKILPISVVSERGHFESIFNPKKPWFPQLQKFTASLGFKDWATKKTLLAEAMAMECNDLPPTYQDLANLIKEVREKYPVIHPDDVELD